MSKKILLGHGSGGKLSHQLINDIFVKYFNNEILDKQTDSAILNIDSANLAFTTDSYVVSPIFFPGGNIGKLAVCGTVNDLSVSGAKPLYLSAGFIIEEGFSFEELEEIVSSMAEEAEKAGVKIVTGDTKVVNKGCCDKIFINTAGVGAVINKDIASGINIKPGDKIIINGFVGDHGITILSERNSLEIPESLKSDCCVLYPLVDAANKVSKDIKFSRDATRGGAATVLCEIAKMNGVGITLDESKIPVRDSVKGICEAFGFDPLYVANEGKIIMIAGSADADKIVNEWKKYDIGKNSAIIGEVTDEHKGKVILETEVGGKRIIDMLSGEQLPRIC